MRRSHAVVIAVLAALGARAGVLHAAEPAPSPRPAFDADQWLREFCPAEPLDAGAIPITPEPVLPELHNTSPPMVPLPPALVGTAVLGAGYVALRGVRVVKRHLRRR